MATSFAGGEFSRVISSIKTVLNVDHGSPTNIDLSATDAVQLGRFASPPTLPFVAVDPVGVDSTTDPLLGVYERTARFLVEGWAAATASTVTAAGLAGFTIANAVVDACELAHRDAGGAFRADPQIRTLDFEEIEFHRTEMKGRKIGKFTASLVMTYTTESGI